MPGQLIGTSDDHGWSSVTGAKDGGRGPCLKRPAEHVLCSVPLMHAPLEPSLAVHSVKEVRLCMRKFCSVCIIERILDVIVQYALEDQHRYGGPACLTGMATSLRRASSFKENPRRASQHPVPEQHRLRGAACLESLSTSLRPAGSQVS